MRYLTLLVLILMSNSGRSQSWEQFQKVVPSDREVNDEFANDVSIDGDYAIIGAMREDDDAEGENNLMDAGSAYIFRYTGSTWEEEAKLVAADRDANDFFGHRVDISGTYCIVGAPQEGSPANAGAAYIFERSPGGIWSQTEKLIAPVQKANDYFGFSVAISGEYAVVGAYFEDEDEEEENEVLSAGSAYIFKRDGAGNWNFQQKIVASDRSVDDRFGRSVDISGDQVIVGAEFDDVGLSTNSGSAYIFKNISDVWTEEAKITASDAGSSENFGWSVAISGDYAIVGAYKNDTDADGLNESPDAGAAYIYEREGGAWPQVNKIVSSDRMNIDYFGYDVAIDGDQALIGAYRQNFAGSGSPLLSDAGAAYVFKRDGSGDWLETEKIAHEDRHTLDQFGISVSIDEDRILCGALTEDEDEAVDNPLPDAGSAYFFDMGSTAVFGTPHSAIRVYPNPAKGYLEIDWGSLRPAEIRIFNLKGQLIIQESLRNSPFVIDISSVFPGIYLLETIDADGKVRSGKFTIQ